MLPEFQPMQKIARLSRDIVITEKIDGSNAQIRIDPLEEGLVRVFDDRFSLLLGPGEAYTIRVGSRKKWITPENDNHGFAKWVLSNLEELVKLGVGSHFGEWWGQGINRGYGLKEKRFSLFRVDKWSDALVRPLCCSVVPVLYRGPLDTREIERWIRDLELCGSRAAPGWMKPEGIVIWHSASGHSYKKTLERDAAPKGDRGNETLVDHVNAAL